MCTHRRGKRWTKKWRVSDGDSVGTTYKKRPNFCIKLNLAPYKAKTQIIFRTHVDTLAKIFDRMILIHV